MTLSTNQDKDPLENPLNEPSLPTCSLLCEEVPTKDYETVEKAMSAWALIAENKKNQEASCFKKCQFEDCEEVSKRVASWLKKPNANDKIYVCSDHEKNTQGAMVVTISNHTTIIDIKHLVTNPINIRSVVNADEPQKVAGAGTCLLKMAEKIAIENGKDSIDLTPLSSSVEFYKKNGFSSLGFFMRKMVQKVHEKVGNLLFQSGLEAIVH